MKAASSESTNIKIGATRNSLVPTARERRCTPRSIRPARLMSPMQAPTMNVSTTMPTARSKPKGIAVMISKNPAGCCSTVLYVPETTRF